MNPAPATPDSSDNPTPCPCPKCGSTRSKWRLSSPDRQFPLPGLFHVSSCLDCGLWFQNPRISLEALGAHYPKDYAPYLVEELGLEPAALWHLRQRQGYDHLTLPPAPDKAGCARGKRTCQYWLLPDFRRQGRVLEVGCAAGNRLMLLKRLGWETCIGNEYSSDACAKVAERGLEVLPGPIDAMLDTFEDNSLDAIIAGFVIEHVPDPFGLARRFAAKLKPGGQLVFNTIQIRTPDFWLYREFWYDLDLPRHMIFFRKKDICDMLAPGFTISSIVYQAALNDYRGSARYRNRESLRGWRGWIDRSILRLDERLHTPLQHLSRLGIAARIFIHARKRSGA